LEQQTSKQTAANQVVDVAITQPASNNKNLRQAGCCFGCVKSMCNALIIQPARRSNTIHKIAAASPLHHHLFFTPPVLRLLLEAALALFRPDGTLSFH